MSNLGPLPFVLSGTAIGTGYTASGAFQLGRAARVTFWTNILLAVGSTITIVTVKLQTRYNDGTVQTSYIDLATDKGDKGTAPGTIEVEHAYSGLSAPIGAPGTPERFFMDNPSGILDVTINVKADHAGIAGDSVTVYPVLG